VNTGNPRWLQTRRRELWLADSVTTVNWEREPGEKVQEFVAALLLLEHPDGNLITPARGDRGVDIQVWHPDGFDIYQVKRYTRPLTSRQVTDVETSWSTFIRETLPVLPVRSWTLVMPWNPTHDRLDWLDELTADAGIPCRWMGRTNLDVLAAQRPSLVDYYFGDGGQRVQRLMADALQGGREMPVGVPAEDMLAAAVERQRSIVGSLNELDPFYRYEVDIRTGAVRDQPWDADTRRPFACLRYIQLDDDHYSVLRLVPRSAESLRLRPITVSARLEVSPGSPEHEAVEGFFQFGAPFQDVPGTITEVSGPAGIATPTESRGLFRFMVASTSAAGLPDLEIRLLTADGAVLHVLDLVDVKASSGMRGPGSWLSGRDRSGAVEFQFLLNGTDGHEFQLNGCPLTGKAPADVLPAVRLMADLRQGTGLVAAIRGGGGPVTPVWEMRNEPTAPGARRLVLLLEALAAIQRHTYDRVTVPDVDTMPQEELDEILHIGRLLNGEQIEATWSEVPLTVGSTDRLPWGGEEFVLAGIFPMTLRLNGGDVTLNMRRRVLYCSARLAEPTEPSSVLAGDTLRLVPGSTARAIIAAVPADEPFQPPQT